MRIKLLVGPRFGPVHGLNATEKAYFHCQSAFWQGEGCLRYATLEDILISQVDQSWIKTTEPLFRYHGLSTLAVISSRGLGAGVVARSFSG